MTLTYEQVMDLLPAYSIGSLEAEEQAAVRDYLDRQLELVQRLKNVETATTLLAYGTQPEPMAPDAKERLLTRIRIDSPESYVEQSIPGDSVYAPGNHVDSDNKELRAKENTGAAVPPRDAASADSNSRPNGNATPAPTRGQNRLRTNRHSPLVGPNRSKQSNPSGRVRRPAPHFVPRQAKRRGRFFSPRGILNAATVAALVTLGFMSLINFQLEQRLRESMLEAEQAKLGLIETQQLNIELARSHTSLTEQNHDLINDQTRLADANAQLMLENDRALRERSELVDDLNKLDAEKQSLAVERAALFEENTRLSSSLATWDERIEVIGTASRATTILGTEAAPGIQGTFFQNEGQGAIVVQGLKPLTGEQVYQVWIAIDSETQVSAGLFNVEADADTTWADVVLPQDLRQYEAIGISVEPAGGSENPSGPMLLESARDVTPPTDQIS